MLVIISWTNQSSSLITRDNNRSGAEKHGIPKACQNPSTEQLLLNKLGCYFFREKNTLHGERWGISTGC